MKFLRGDLIADKYRVVDRLGEGGMGVVLLAKHELLGLHVAVKITHASTNEPEHRERFLREGRIMAQVSSAHAVRLNDVGQLPTGELFLVMERLEGKDLATTVEREGPLAIPIAVDVVLQALDALAEAHSLGIVHRDLKPANIFLTRDASGRMLAKVLDFGISKAMREDVALTSTGAVMGSPLYMAPEQVRSAKAVHVETDIWALGIVLCEALTGRAPFNGSNAGEVFAAILEAQLPPLHLMRPDIPAGLLQVITKCLARHMSERYRSCGELAQALAPYGTGQCQPNVARAIGFAPQRASADSSSGSFAQQPISNVTLPLMSGSSPSLGTASTQQSWTDVSKVRAAPPRSSLVRILSFVVGMLLVLAVGTVAALFFVKPGAMKSVAKADTSAAVATAPLPTTSTLAAASVATPVAIVSATPSATATTTAPTLTQPPAWVPPTPVHTGKVPLKETSRTQQ